MDYGSDEGVKTLLAIYGVSTFSDNQLARIPLIRAAMSRTLEQKTGARFGVQAPEALTVFSERAHALWLPKPIRTLTSIVENPTAWDGTAWTDGSVVPATDYHLGAPDSSGRQWFVEGVNRSWRGRFVVTGVWADQVYDAGTDNHVPADADYVVNYTAAEAFKKLQASPAGLIGSDSVAVPIRNPWKDPEVCAIVERYSATRAVWVI